MLAEAMRTKGMNADKLARETGISERFLRLIIEERFDKLPAAPYLHGYIMKIAEVLEIDGEKLWATYFKNNRYLKSSGTGDRLPKNRFAVSRVNRRVLIFAIIIVAIVAYFVVRSVLGLDIARELRLQGFDENIIVSQDNTYKLKGNINTAFKLTINDTPIYPESNGDFERTLELEPGFNTVTFRVKGSLNKKDELVKQIYCQTEATSTPVSKEAAFTPPGGNNF